MNNKQIREKMKQAGLKQWEVAEAYGISEFTFSRWLRREISKEKQKEILLIIRRMSR